jgi:hypothetical protein
MNKPKFTFQENGVHFLDSSGREQVFSFRDRLKVRFRPYRKFIQLKGPTGSASLEGLSNEEQSAFLKDFFRRWLSANPEAARKGAFDYAEDRKSFCRLVVAVCLLFTGPMAVALLNDSLKQTSCTKMLTQNVQSSAIDVTKVKKEKKGPYILKLAFTPPNGKTITAEERWITENENEIPKSLPIIFSPSQPECWAMTTTGTEISWAKRRYFSAVSGMFGAFFLAITLFGLFWSVARLLWLPPYREEVLSINNK